MIYILVLQMYTDRIPALFNVNSCTFSNFDVPTLALHTNTFSNSKGFDDFPLI